jgi:hypothetical protein
MMSNDGRQEEDEIFEKSERGTFGFSKDVPAIVVDVDYCPLYWDNRMIDVVGRSCGTVRR